MRKVVPSGEEADASLLPIDTLETYFSQLCHKALFPTRNDLRTLSTNNTNKEVSMSDKNALDYWKSNIRLVLSLLGIWFFISFGCGILLADTLDEIRIGGFKLGFWIAQQGAILVFVILIYVYIYLMDKLDDAYNLNRDEGKTAEPREEAQ